MAFVVVGSTVVVVGGAVVVVGCTVVVVGRVVVVAVVKMYFFITVSQVRSQGKIQSNQTLHVMLQIILLLLVALMKGKIKFIKVTETVK